MPPPYTGGCQCGTVRYEISAEPLTVYACHCQGCQKQTASAFSLGMWVLRNTFKITQGAPVQWRRTAESGRVIIGNLCSTCGTRLYNEAESNPARLNIKPGTLDDTSWLEPVGHVWIQHAQPWVNFDGDLLNYATQPNDAYEAMIKRYQARHSVS